MYEYKIIRVKKKFWGGIDDNYHRIIDDYARNGWRLVQLFAPGVEIWGTAPFVELIFEKKKSE